MILFFSLSLLPVHPFCPSHFFLSLSGCCTCKQIKIKRKTCLQTNWCTRRRSTSRSQTIWTRLSQNSRHTRRTNKALLLPLLYSTTTAIHFRFENKNKTEQTLFFREFVSLFCCCCCCYCVWWTFDCCLDPLFHYLSFRNALHLFSLL